MNHVSLTTPSNKPIPDFEPDPDLTTLPADVMPTIFNRLSPTDFFGLACTSKKVNCLVQPFLHKLATCKLDAFSTEDLEKSIDRLAPLFRTGCLHISGQAGLVMLKKAGNTGIDRELLETLLFSFASDDTKLPELPESQETLEKDHSASQYKLAMWIFFERGIQEMIDADRHITKSTTRTRQLSLRPGWKGLVEIFKKFDICDQIRLLAWVKVRPCDGENILLAFEELVAAHLAALAAADNFIFPPDGFRKDQIDRYYSVLADVCTLAPAPGEDSFLLSLCKKGSFSWFPGFLPWRQNWCGPCNLMFRLLAIEARKDKPADMEAWSNPVADKALKMFITRKELTHFVKKLDARMDQDMRLELAVSKWIDENREPGKCVIS